jgi:hypothetical protein
MAQGVEPNSDGLTSDPDKPKYGSMTFTGTPSKSVLDAASAAKQRQGRLALFVFVIAIVIACCVGFLGLDDVSGRISVKWQGGYFRGGLAAFIVVAGTFLAWRMANDSITVRGSRK